MTISALIPTILIILALSIVDAAPRSSKMSSVDKAKELHIKLFHSYDSPLQQVLRPTGHLAGSNNSGALKIKLTLKLVQLTHLDIRNQMMVTKHFLRQQWTDERLTWDPKEYAGNEQLQINPRSIWLPDVVLYNTADGNYAPNASATSFAKVVLYYNGTVVYEPPLTLNSFCAINMHSFPFDSQCCNLKFGSWSYSAKQVALELLSNYYDSDGGASIDLSLFDDSNAEWDLRETPGKINSQIYSYEHAGPEPYDDATFQMCMKRRSLFYTVYLVIPATAINFLAVLAFCLPPDSLEKTSLSISILLALIWFLNLYLELSPPSSLVVPLLGKYLLFTTVLIFMSTAGCVYTLHTSFVLRRSVLNKKPPSFRSFVKKLCKGFEILADTAVRSRNDPDEEPNYEAVEDDSTATSTLKCRNRGYDRNTRTCFCDKCVKEQCMFDKKMTHLLVGNQKYRELFQTDFLYRAMYDIKCIAKSLKRKEFARNISFACKERGMFADRVLFLVFTTGCILAGIEIFAHCCVPGFHEEGEVRTSLNRTSVNPARTRYISHSENED